MSKKYKFIILFVFFVLFINPIVYAKGDGEENLPSSIDIHMGEDGLVKLTKDKNVDNVAAWKVFIIKYRKFVVGIAGFAAVTMVFLFIKNFLKLGAVANNPQARSEALKGLLVTGIATALLGSVATITALFYNTLK